MTGGNGIVLIALRSESGRHSGIINIPVLWVVYVEVNI